MPLFATVLTAVQIVECSHMYSCLGSGNCSNTVIDLGLAELHNVRDSVAPRSYVDSRSQAFSDSWAWARLEAKLLHRIKPRKERVRYLLVAGRKRLVYPACPGDHAGAAEERHGRGTQSRGGSLDGHYVAPARSVTAKVPGIVPRLHLPNLWRWSLGTRLYYNYLIAHNQWMK